MTSEATSWLNPEASLISKLSKTSKLPLKIYINIFLISLDSLDYFTCFALYICSRQQLEGSSQLVNYFGIGEVNCK